MNIESGFNEYTGRQFESEILAQLPDSWKNEGYFTLDKSYQWVKDHQMWNLSDPLNPEHTGSHVANDLHYKVAEALGLDEVGELKFFSALNSPLDRHYGIDAFFQIGDVIITIDFTKNTYKDIYKADVIVRPEDVDDEAGMERIAQQISQSIQNNRSVQRRSVA